MVGLHALKGVDEHALSGEVIGLLLGGDGALDGATGPEGMAHGAPGVRGVGAEVGGAVLADDETGCGASKGEVDQTVVVDGGLKDVLRSLLVQGQRQVVGAK